MTNLTQQGIAALKSGDIQAARNYLSQAVKLDNQNAAAWLALSFAVKSPEQKRYCTVLFGGHCTGQGGALLNDTWVLENDQWRELTFSRTPSPRWGHVMFYDWQRQSVMLFGGVDGQRYKNDMWELSFAPGPQE
jgi:hypothetical protein